MTAVTTQSPKAVSALPADAEDELMTRLEQT